MVDSSSCSPCRPESFKLAHVVRDLTGYDMGASAHTAVEDARAARRLLRVRLVRDAIFPWASRTGVTLDQQQQTKVVALRQVVGRIRWLRYMRELGRDKEE